MASFRVFSKDDEGCIPAEEMKFVLSQVMMMTMILMLKMLLISIILMMNWQVCSMEEAEEMLEVVDRNGDGVISYSEFRCMMGANPILL